VRLPPADEAPPEFVPVVDLTGQTSTFYILDREVTAGEYLQFLNDPGSRPLLERSPLVPRDFNEKPFFPKDAQGRYALPPGWTSDYPVVGVSWHDAVAYAEWRTARDGCAYALPTYAEWQHAGGPSRHYPFGNHFRPKWAKSCYSRERACIEPVQSYAVDESLYGPFDMSGSAMEWLDDWYVKGRRRVAGGSWAQGGPETLFRLSGGFGLDPSQANAETGFRLVRVTTEGVRKSLK
jgi:formylglycine-generating enzyme required for sulfatase activity